MLGTLSPYSHHPGQWQFKIRRLEVTQVTVVRRQPEMVER